MKYYIELTSQGGKGEYVFSPIFYGGYEGPELKTTSIIYVATVSDAMIFTNIGEVTGIARQLRELTFSPEIRTISSN